MPLPPKPLHPLPEVAKRWGLKVHDLGSYALEGTLTLSIVVPRRRAETGEWLQDQEGAWHAAYHGEKTVSGLHDVLGTEVWPAFTGRAATLYRLQPLDPDLYVRFAENTGLTVTRADLVVRQAELERFETTHDIRPSPPRTRRHRIPGPGAPARHDWEGLLITLCRQIHDDGYPATQADLVRKAMDWFGTHADTVPDESTVRKKIARLWREAGRP